MVSHDPRHTAWMILKESTLSKRTLDHTLEGMADTLNEMSRRDRALTNALVYGTLRWKGYLDGIIAAFSSKRLEDVDPEVMWLLRMALFQIIHLDKIPVSAAVNTAVDVAKKEIHKGAAGFINAVLRKAAPRWQTVTAPPADTAPAEFIAMEKSLPLWLARRWLDRYGIKKTLLLCDAVNTIPPITLRVNTLKTDREQLLAALVPDTARIEKTSFSLLGLRIKGPKTAIHDLTSFTAGDFQVQDEAAQLVTSHFLAPQPGERVLDACAGLGGKTGHMAQLMENCGEVVAADADPDKLKRLEQEMQRLGVDMVTTRRMNLLKADETVDIAPFDRILVDAPCSGLGVLRRNPDTRWKRSKKDIARLAVKQEKMLSAAAELVKPGGTLVYAVCSCEPRENEKVIEHFLDRHNDFSIDKTKSLTPDDAAPACRDGFFRTYPDVLDMDGFFAVAMTRSKV